MTLRTRILVGYGYLISLLVLSAMGAALGFHQLGTSIGQVLEENFRSVRAAMDMLEALERQDSAVLAMLLGDPGSSEPLHHSEAAFLEAMGRARANVTIEGELAAIGEIEARFEAFRQARDELLASRPERPLAAYERETFPRFEQVKTALMALLELNHQAMVEADRKAQGTARRRALGLGLLVAAAILSFGFLSRELSRQVLARLDELRAVAEAIAAGDHARRATVTHGDELGVVAQQLNAVLDRQLTRESTARGREARLRQLLIALTEASGERAALLTLTGEVVVAGLDDDLVATLRATVAGLEPAERARSELELELEGETVRLRRLGAEQTPVGWLAVAQTPAPSLD